MPNPFAPGGGVDPTTFVHPACAGVVILDQTPRIFALYREEDVVDRPEEGVVGWVFALPTGNAVVVRQDGDGSFGHVVVSPSIERVALLWAQVADQASLPPG